ncbi:hypothetical protein BD414DRAFT_487143 [Trametes punicea]|nr:hypothetical protein BD414DRAFT_487143 [Trametes punicea]
MWSLLKLKELEGASASASASASVCVSVSADLDEAVTCEPGMGLQRQLDPDPDGRAVAVAAAANGSPPPPNTLFTHDPRLSNKPPCQCSPSCQCLPCHLLSVSPPPRRRHPSPSPSPQRPLQQPLKLGVVYLLHAPPRPPSSLKMPVSSESTLAVPLQTLPPQPPSSRPLSRADKSRMLDNHHIFPFRRLQLLSLNRDVLKTISDFCAPGDALQLAMTCKDAYELAMPRVLSDVSIGDPALNDGPDRLGKFCTFMLAEPRRRIKHLRALRLLEGAFARVTSVGGRERLDADFSSADVLANLLRHADNLRLIHIRDAEALFQHHPAVYEALSQLTTLNEVSLYYIGNSTLKAISQLRSTPAVIENGLWKDGPRPQGDITPFGPFVDSLRHLKLWECGCMLESVIDRHVWPNLHTLDIGGRIAKISELAHAFPNLRRLTFYLEFSVKPETGPATCWPELDYLETSAPIPSFPSPVRRLQLQYPLGSAPGPHSPSDLKTLPLMERTNPVVLSCTISDTASGTMLERMKSSMPSLRYLELVYTDGPCGRCGVQWQAFQNWTERYVDILRTTSLVGLCVGYAGAADPSSASETRRRRTHALARTLAKRVKSLQYIGIGTQDAEAGMYALDSAWYRVSSRPADENTTPVLETLSPAEGERVRETLLDTPREA